KPYPPDRIRNVAVTGHGSTGKTSLVEAMLFTAKTVDRLGRVDDGTSTTDFDPEEQRRKHTINAALAPLEWRDHKINLVDAPGYPDFVGEVVAALRATESAIVVVDAVAGVQVQTEVAWALAERRGVSRLIVVNRLDRENASFDRTLQSLRARFGNTVAPIQIPIGAEAGFSGVVDLLEMKAYAVRNGEMVASEIPPDLAAAAQAAREKLTEAAAESEDALVEKYLETGALTQDEVTRGLHAGVKAGTLVPVLCAAATKLIGVSLLLNEIVTLLPGPVERHEVAATDQRTQKPVTVAQAPGAPLAALIFKTVADPYVGKLSYFRVHGDPTLRVHRATEMKQTIISGMGESHLEITADRLRRKFSVDVVLGTPRVPYRETIRAKAKAQGRYVKQTGGHGQYGVCFIDIEPLSRSSGFEFVDKIRGGAIPNQFVVSVEKGVRKALEEGVLAGYPVVDVRVLLVDGKYHEVDSSDIAFQIAGSMAFKEAATAAGLVLLEP